MKQITCKQPFDNVRTGALHSKPNSGVWSGFLIIAAPVLTLSFKAACSILSIRNGRVDVSAVCCTVIASFVELLMHSPGLNAGRGAKGSNCWLCSNMSGGAVGLRSVYVCVCILSFPKLHGDQLLFMYEFTFMLRRHAVMDCWLNMTLE